MTENKTDMTDGPFFLEMLANMIGMMFATLIFVGLASLLLYFIPVWLKSSFGEWAVWIWVIFLPLAFVSFCATYAARAQRATWKGSGHG